MTYFVMNTLTPVLAQAPDNNALFGALAALGFAFVGEETGKRRAFAAGERACAALEARCARALAASRARAWCGGAAA